MYYILYFFCTVLQRCLNALSELRNFCAVRTWGGPDPQEPQQSPSCISALQSLRVLPCDPVANPENNELRLLFNTCSKLFCKAGKKKKSMTSMVYSRVNSEKYFSDLHPCKQFLHLARPACARSCSKYLAHRTHVVFHWAACSCHK